MTFEKINNKYEYEISHLSILEEFRNELLDVFMDACHGNDFNKLTLVSIGDIIDSVYNKHRDKIIKEE